MSNFDGGLIYPILDALNLPRTSATRVVVDIDSIMVEGLAHDADGKKFVHRGSNEVARYVVSAKIDWPLP